MEHTKIKTEAEHDLKASSELLQNLFEEFGEQIPVDAIVNLSAANLAKMASIIAEYSLMKIDLLKYMKTDNIKFDEVLKLDESQLDIFKLGISSALDLVGECPPEEIDLTKIVE